MAAEDATKESLLGQDVLVPISDVERQTGIPQATLRIWERRYGFPRPLRDMHGDRIYPMNQVERLQVVRRLLEQGMRPGKVLCGDVDLDRLAARSKPEEPGSILSGHERAIEQLRQYRTRELRADLHVQLINLGLNRFVTEVLAPLTHAMGLAWQYGRLPVRCEHLFSEQVRAVLHFAMLVPQPVPRAPKVVLGTLNYETHLLGILMAEAILTTRQVECIQLGGSLPVGEVAHAAIEAQADIVALSFSASFPRKQLLQRLAELRASLPEQIELWVGGEGVQHLGQGPSNITVFTSLAAIDDALDTWRRARA